MLCTVFFVIFFSFLLLLKLLSLDNQEKTWYNMKMKINFKFGEKYEKRFGI